MFCTVVYESYMIEFSLLPTFLILCMCVYIHIHTHLYTYTHLTAPVQNLKLYYNITKIKKHLIACL